MNDAAAVAVLSRTADERTFRTHDGVDLFYRHWPAPDGPARGAILLFHRGHEHSGRMAHLVDELGLPDFDFFLSLSFSLSLSRGAHRIPRPLDPGRVFFDFFDDSCPCP